MSPFIRKLFRGGKRKFLLLIAAAVILAFIWSQSLLSTDLSADESGWITNHIINPILRLVGLSVPDGFVRKAAHVTEFAVLGLIVTLLWDCHPIRSFYSGFTIAFIDETIQVLVKRGPMITDVWIDLIGVTIGFFIAVWIDRARKRKRKRNRNSKNE